VNHVLTIVGGSNTALKRVWTLPAMLALRQWGQKKYGTEMEEKNPVLVDARDRLPIGLVFHLAQDGRIPTVPGFAPASAGKSGHSRRWLPALKDGPCASSSFARVLRTNPRSSNVANG
jgi:hypothetical protein